MTELLTSVLIAVSTLLGVSTTPPKNSQWWPNKVWEKVNDAYVFEASSTEIQRHCTENPSWVLQLPQVIHGVHEVRTDGRTIFRSGDPSFQKAAPFYAHPSVPCELLQASTKVTWIIYSYSKYFSRFTHYPEIIKEQSLGTLLDLNLNVIAVGALIFLSLFSYYLFTNRMENSLVYSLILGALFFATYFLMCVSSEFGIRLSMLTTHKMADIALFIGSIFYFYVFHKFGFLSLQKLKIYSLVTAFNCAIILGGKTGDVIQFGTSANLPFTMLILLSTSFSAWHTNHRDHSNRIAWLNFCSILIFVATSSSDILHTFGVIDVYMTFPVGAISGILLLALSANQQIEITYRERDSLLLSLENKVAEKTKDLSQALENLKQSQAELVQSAKLASLGTLSAGIAHEINNSINFVNGAIVPLERKVLKCVPANEQESLRKLFDALKHGTDLTVQIVRSLRNFTGLNQAAFRDIQVAEVVNSVLTILKSKLRNCNVEANIAPELRFEGSQVGLSQALMNIIINALDALPLSNGKITITAKEVGDFVEIKISDNGAGIPEAIKARIFDPFFTTKEVGKGTGLGLFIVKKEIDRHGGKLQVESEPGAGTTFTLHFPLHNPQITKESAGAASGKRNHTPRAAA